MQSLKLLELLLYYQRQSFSWSSTERRKNCTVQGSKSIMGGEAPQYNAWQDVMHKQKLMSQDSVIQKQPVSGCPHYKAHIICLSYNFTQHYNLDDLNYKNTRIQWSGHGLCRANKKILSVC